MKNSGAELGFVDRFSGTLIITGSLADVESAVQAVLAYAERSLGVTVCPLTKT